MHNNVSLIKISGTDATELLQRLLTIDINLIQDRATYPACLLSPQGKILFLFNIFCFENSYYLDINNELCAELAKKLSFYKLGADAAIEIIATKRAITHDQITSLVAHRDTRFVNQNIYYYYELLSDLPSEKNHIAATTQLHIKAGLARINVDFAPNTVFPHDINLDLLGGVSFTKGCYIGQEVVSRMQHRNGVRKRLVCVKSTNKSLKKSEPIMQNGKVIGEVIASFESDALAIIRIDKIEQLQNFTAGESTVTLANPPYNNHILAI